MSKVIESLRLQKQFHSNQIDLIVIRREQHDKYMATQLEVDKGKDLRSNLEDSRKVQVELFKSLDNVEKVVEVLEQKTLSGGSKEASEFLSQMFEDLKLLNHQSMLLVNRLVTQLDDRITENEELRELLASGSVNVPPQSSRTSSLEKKSRELSDSDQDLPKFAELPPLPTIDFNTFMSSLSPDTQSADEEEKEHVADP